MAEEIGRARRRRAIPFKPGRRGGGGGGPPAGRGPPPPPPPPPARGARARPGGAAPLAVATHQPATADSLREQVDRFGGTSGPPSIVAAKSPSS